MTGAGPERLIYMANQIAGFFATQPGGTAAAGTAGHLKAFWTPRMRQELIAWLKAGGGGLDPLAAEAVRLLAGASLVRASGGDAG